MERAAAGDPEPVGMGSADDSLAARRRRIGIFLLGTLFQIGSVIYEVVVADFCFTDEENVVGQTDDPEGQGRGVLFTFRFTLVLGLAYDLLSSFILSKTFRSPLDAKHAYKVPREHEGGCCTTFLIRHATPFVWGVVFILLGAVSAATATPTCDLSRSENVKVAMSMSGIFMMLIGGFLCSVLGVLLPLFGLCCEPTLACFYKILRTFPLIDLIWQGQGLLLSYSIGSLGVVGVSVLAGLEVLAVFLTSVGSFVLPGTKVGLDAADLGL